MAESQKTEPAKSAESKPTQGTATGSPPAQAEKAPPTASAAPFSLSASDAVDPRTGESFDPGKPQGGVAGFDVLEGDAVAVPSVDPKRIPAEVTHGVSPDAGGNKLLAAAQAAAPSLTQEFVDTYKLDDEFLGRIARREVPPPPTNGPLRTSDLYLTPGGWQSVPPGQNPEDVGKNAISR
jgi:hypothetical protein